MRDRYSEKHEKHEKRKNARQMKEHLEQIQSQGAEIYLDGEAVEPDDVVGRAVKEDEVYMADYIIGRDGNVEQVRFDRIGP